VTASAKVFVLKRDEHDREYWGDSIYVLDGHWNPAAALTHFFYDGDDPPGAGTYKCDSSGGTAVLGWTGDKIVAV
jgi:hypothetical protein